MLAVERDAVVVRVSGGEWRVKYRNEGSRAGWKHWTNIPKKNIINVGVESFWARQPQELGYTVDMCDVMDRIRDDVLHLDFELYWDIEYRGKLHELYWIESRYGWTGDFLME